MPKVTIVDMKNERITSTSNFSTYAIDKIRQNIEHHHQTFVYINRRGYFAYVTCKSCGKVLQCKNCDVALTYHEKLDMLLCHYCSYVQKNIGTCPYCQSQNLIHGGIGTEQIEQELHELIPGINTLRMDADTTVKRGSHEEILNKFKNDNVDVLVGTQMISKGHDIENVTLVVVINADSAITGNDYLSVEKGFSNLLQVTGRAGRGKSSGEAIVQAYDVDNYAINALKNQSYEQFYNEEIEFRQNNKYPPFVDIVIIEVSGISKELINTLSYNMYNILNKNSLNIYQVYSPKTPYISKIKNKYMSRIIIKTKICDKVLDLLYANLVKCDKIIKKGCSISVIVNPLKIC